VILRDYQRKGSDAVYEQWREVDSTLLVYPTGCGKTILFADVIRRSFPKRSMVLAHREELIWQAQDKISRSTGLRCEVEMADYRAQGDANLFSRAPVVISTIQTQTAGGDGGGRMGKFDPFDFGVLIIDEAHHATAQSYRRVIDYYRTNPALKVLGVTATPDRADEEALGQVFQSVAYDYEILDAIHDGWLVPIEQQMVNIDGLDFSAIRTTAGDLNGADLAAVMEAEKNMHGIASASIEIVGMKRSLVFTASVKHASTLAEIFNRHRPGMAAWVCGKTDKDQRRKILADFASGKVQVVCNCGVLTEGFDDPGVEVIIMGRPTKSRSLYSQMVGRSTRPLPGLVDRPETPGERRAIIASSPKPSCLVVDFVGNSGQHKLITSAEILGGKVSEEAVAKAKLHAKQAGKPVRMVELLDETENEIEQKRLAEEARRARIIAQAKWTVTAINPFDVLEVRPVQPRGWDHGKQLTEKQRSLLTRQGINPDTMPYAQAKQLIGELMYRWEAKLCTFKQAKLLRKHGYPTNVTMQEASQIIDGLAKNGWRRPVEVVAA
jgi:superfamily II DNA or RNA helicase